MIRPEKSANVDVIGVNSFHSLEPLGNMKNGRPRIVLISKSTNTNLIKRWSSYEKDSIFSHGFTYKEPWNPWILFLQDERRTSNVQLGMKTLGPSSHGTFRQSLRQSSRQSSRQRIGVFDGSCWKITRLSPHSGLSLDWTSNSQRPTSTLKEKPSVVSGPSKNKMLDTG